MAYTEADLIALKAARLKLATGQTIESVRYSDGKEVRYSSAKMSELDSIIAAATAETTAAGGMARRRYIRVISSKGL